MITGNYVIRGIYRGETMVKNPFMEKRRETLTRVGKIMASTSPIKVSKMMSIIEINTGLSSAKARDYINTHVRTGAFSIKEGLIKKEGEIYERSNKFERTEERNQRGNIDRTGTERGKPETERTIIK